MTQGTTTYWVIVTVVTASGEIISRCWTGTKPRGIIRAAKLAYQERYPGCRITYSKAIPVNHYGAH